MSHPRLAFTTLPAALYAVGDIHGCLAEYRLLESRIIVDALGIEGEKWIVTLGDHIDRGPDSAGVIAAIRAPPPEGFRRLALLGNHERMLLDFVADPLAHLYWLEEGGLETLLSYGFELPAGPWREGDLPYLTALMRDTLPSSDLDWIRALPLSIELPGWTLVHAGLRPGVNLADQSEQDMLWIREPFLSSTHGLPTRVVHGHTPGPLPVVLPHRIGIDTQCFLTGRLTALRILPNDSTHFLTSS